MVGKITRKSHTESTVEYVALDAPYPEGVWFTCDYGESNQFTLARKLEPGIKTCVVRYKTIPGSSRHSVEVMCK